MPAKRRLSPGEVLAAIAAAALLISTVLPWFQQKSSGGITGSGGPGLERMLNAWQAFIVLAIAVVLVASVPVWQVVRRRRSDAPASPHLLLAAALGLTLVLAGGSVKLGDRGGTGPDAIRVSTTPEVGFVIAVMAALLIATGGVVAMWRLPRVPGA